MAEGGEGEDELLAREQRAATRGRWQRRLDSPAAFVAGAVLLAVVAAVLWGRDGAGPLGPMLGPEAAAFVDPSGDGGARDRTPPSATATSSTTTTLYNLRRGNYEAGDCLRWDVRHGAGQQDPKVVDCREPHLLEFTGYDTAPDAVAYPSDAEWVAIRSDQCERLAELHLGHPLDPGGRFVLGGFRPTPQSWAQGDRTIVCGLEARRPLGTGSPPQLFTGSVEGQDQSTSADTPPP